MIALITAIKSLSATIASATIVDEAGIIISQEEVDREVRSTVIHSLIDNRVVLSSTYRYARVGAYRSQVYVLHKKPR